MSPDHFVLQLAEALPVTALMFGILWVVSGRKDHASPPAKRQVFAGLALAVLLMPLARIIAEAIYGLDILDPGHPNNSPLAYFLAPIMCAAVGVLTVGFIAEKGILARPVRSEPDQDHTDTWGPGAR